MTGPLWTTHEDTILKLAAEMKLEPEAIASRYLNDRSPDSIRRRLIVVNKPIMTVSHLKQLPPIAIVRTAEEENLADRSAGLNASMWAYYDRRARLANCTPIEAAVLFCGMRA